MKPSVVIGTAGLYAASARALMSLLEIVVEMGDALQRSGACRSLRSALSRV